MGRRSNIKRAAFRWQIATDRNWNIDGNRDRSSQPVAGAQETGVTKAFQSERPTEMQASRPIEGLSKNHCVPCIEARRKKHFDYASIRSVLDDSTAFSDSVCLPAAPSYVPMSDFPGILTIRLFPRSLFNTSSSIHSAGKPLNGDPLWSLLPR